jgi:hypothetical protein
VFTPPLASSRRRHQPDLFVIVSPRCERPSSVCCEPPLVRTSFPGG